MHVGIKVKSEGTIKAQIRKKQPTLEKMKSPWIIIIQHTRLSYTTDGSPYGYKVRVSFDKTPILVKAGT